MNKRHIHILPVLGLISISQVTFANHDATRIIGFDGARSISINSSNKNGDYVIQAASFKSENNAKKYRNKLAARTKYPVTTIKEGQYFVVLIGPVATKDALNKTINKLKGASSASLAKWSTNTSSGEQKQLKTGSAKPKGIVSSINQQGPYVGVGLLYGQQSLNAITSREEINGSVQVDSMNPFKISDNKFGFYISGGKVWPMDGWQLRTELQYNYHGKLSGSISPAFPEPPVGVPNFNTSFRTSVKAQSAFINAFFQKMMNDTFAVFAGGGIGLAYKQANSTMVIDSPPWPSQDTKSNSTTGFAWQLGLGGIYYLNPQLAINIMFMHSDLGKPNFGTFYSHQPSIPGRAVESNSWVANNFQIGLVYTADS